MKRGCRSPPRIGHCHRRPCKMRWMICPAISRRHCWNQKNSSAKIFGNCAGTGRSTHSFVTRPRRRWALVKTIRRAVPSGCRVLPLNSGPDYLPIAARVGVRVEASPNSLQTTFTGWGKEGRVQAKLDDTALVTQISGFNVQAFAHQNWWGPGWQSSLINGSNVPPWMGVGIQRSEVKPSESKWLSWMGPWTFEMFAAHAQDPVLVANQPDGYYFIGSRLTLKPWSWMEIGLTRDIQMGGSGQGVRH